MTSTRERSVYEEYLQSFGTDDVQHLGGNVFSEHLVGVQRVLERWGAPKEVSLAGLFHSIYGTEGFQGFSLGLDKRAEVQALVGERAERTAYINCVMDRATLDALVLAPRAPDKRVRVREELGLQTQDIPLTDEQFTDLVTVHLADWLEQVEREAAKPCAEAGWKEAGEAWGYRREAYKRMAELLGGVPLAAYKETFAREPPHTRHLHQTTTVRQQPLYRPTAVAA